MAAGSPITRDEAVAMLRAFGERYGRAPTSLELKRPAEYHVPHGRTLTRLFGGVKAGLEAAGLPARPRGMHATTGTPVRQYQLRKVQPDPSPLTPLNHQWYRTGRIVEFLVGEYGCVEAVTRELNQRGDLAMIRRWHVIHNGWYTDRGAKVGAEWVSLPVVDKLLTVLDLHIWHLGDPDRISRRPPGDQLSLEQEAA